MSDPTTSRNAESSNAYDEQVMMPPETLLERMDADGRLWRLAFTEAKTEADMWAATATDYLRLLLPIFTATECAEFEASGALPTRDLSYPTNGV